MRLKYILNKLNINKLFIDHKVEGLSLNSKECRCNYIFFMDENNEKYIEEAKDKGVKTIINSKFSGIKNNINYLKFDNVRKVMAIIARIYYKDISKKLNLIGITGTEGKTSSTTLCYSLFNYYNMNSILIGTNGIFTKYHKWNTNNTTLNILDLYKYLVYAKKNKIKYVFMELSSIGIDELRIYGINFNILVLTNLKQDHLDYHKNINYYHFTKMIPFLTMNPEYVIINNDIDNVNYYLKYINSNIITYSINNESNYKANLFKDYFMVNDYIYKTNLIGDFNIYNCLIGIIIGNLYNIDNIKINKFYNEFKYVDGRMNKYIFNKKNIIIDYAHTYSSIVEVIDYILKITENPYIVLGLGGNREKEKREMVGKYLNTIKANIILTSDNPRYEEPVDIINQIKKYIDKEVIEIVDRKQAIIYALDNMKENEYLVILGKGNEEYIEIKGNKYKYSDIEVIYEYFK